MTVASPRIEKLRAHALAARPAGGGGAEWEYNGYKGWLDSCRDGRSLPMRWGMTKRSVLSHADAVIDDGELLVGKYAVRALTPEEEAELEQLRRYVAPAMPAASADASTVVSLPNARPLVDAALQMVPAPGTGIR